MYVIESNAILHCSCAADTDLFPHFTHVGQGILSATFGAFRTTDLNGGSVPMTFSCSLQVCLGSCSAVSFSLCELLNGL